MVSGFKRLVPAHADAFNIEGAGSEMLLVYAGRRPNPVINEGRIEQPPE